MPDYIPARYHSLANVINPNIPALAARGFLSTLGDVQMPGAMREPTPLNLQQALAQDPNILLARRQQEQARAQEFGAKAEQAGIEAYEATFKQLGTQMSVIGKALTAVDTPEEWEAMREMLDKTDPGIRKLMSLPDAFDPVALDQGRKMTLSGAEYFTQRAKAQQAAAENPKFGFVLDLTAIPEDATDEEKAAHWQGVVDLWRAQGADPALVRQFEVYTPQGYTFAKRLAQVGQQAVTKPSAADKPPTVGSFEDYVIRFAREKGVPPEQLGPADIELARKRYQQADDRPPASILINPLDRETLESNARMLADGRAVPTIFSKRGTGPTSLNRMIAMADKISRQEYGKPYNPLKAEMDFASGRRFIASLNGPQMVRFRALADSVVKTIDEVNLYAKQLQQGGIQLWNKATRDTIMQVYGNTPYSEAAAKYMGAVNTLKEEYANLAQGGYAPTEPAWALSNQVINANFGAKDLQASLNEVQRLINFRIAAFDEQEPRSWAPGQGQYELGDTGGKTGTTIIKIERGPDGKLRRVPVKQ